MAFFGDPKQFYRHLADQSMLSNTTGIQSFGYDWKKEMERLKAEEDYVVMPPLDTRTDEEKEFDEAMTALSRIGMPSNCAADDINDFTRARIREDNIYRRIMPPLHITNDELDRSVDTDKPLKVWI